MTGTATVDERLLVSETERRLTVVARLSETTPVAGAVREHLEAHADRTQEPLRTFAEEHEGVEIKRSFWITNAAVLELDTEAVTLSELAEVRGIEHLQANATLEPVGTTSQDARTAVELTVESDQPATVEAGSAVEVVLSGSGVAALTVEATGNYDGGAAELVVAGESADFGDPVELDDPDGEIPVTVETGTQADGLLGLDHTATGGGTTATVSTGPSSVVDGTAVVGIIQEDSDWGDIPGTLEAELGADHYEFQQVTTTDVLAEPASYDAVVANRFDPDQTPPEVAADLVEVIETTDTGGLFVDQYGDGANSIFVYELVSDNVTGTEQSIDGDPSYEIRETHPILSGFEPDEQVLLHTSDQGDDVTWFDTAPASPFDRLADVVGVGGFEEGLVVDEGRGTVLAASLGRTFFTGGEFTDEADQILGQAVAYVAGSGLSTGATGTIERAGDPVGDATVELDGSTVRTDAAGSFAVFADPGTYDLTVSGFGIEETTVTVDIEDEGELTDIGTVAVDAVVDVAVETGQPADIESGASLSVALATVDATTLSVAATGDYSEDDANLFVAGESADFGEPVDIGDGTQDIAVSVETATDTNGSLGLAHTVAGADTTATVDSGPTYVFGEDPGQRTYGLDQLGAPVAWDRYDTQGEGGAVAVLDTGADPDHPDVEVDAWSEFDENGEPVRSDPFDIEDGSGTHVSGTVAGGNELGTWIGVAPEADLYVSKVVQGATGTVAALIAGIEWAVEEDADAMTIGLGVLGYESAFIDPVANAAAAGTFPVTPVGGRFSGESSSPGNLYGSSLAVGGSGEAEDIKTWSGGEDIETEAVWGEDPPADWPETYTVPDVAAPGSLTASADPGGGYMELSGSQMSAAHVAGAVALLQAGSNVDLDPGAFRTVLETTARKPASWEVPDDEQDTRYGYGLVDVDTALSLATGELGIVGVELDPVPGPGGETHLTLTAEFADRVVVDALWTDWTVTVVDDDGATDHDDRVETAGEFELSWKAPLGTRTPVLELALPDRYIGGTYKLGVEAAAGAETVDETATFDIVEE